jgi:HD-GYP domain-containing protein (c-di-GMP phosphodiesterase class II)
MTGNLKPISIALLYDDMLVKDDIYNAESGVLLAKRGTVLNERLIKAIRTHNEDRDTIFVSAEVHQDLQSRKVPMKIARREEIEESTGYSEAKDKTFELLDEMTQSKTINKNALNDVADELSERLEINTPSTITTLINALAPVDEYLQRHCVNISLLNGLFGKWMGMSKSVVDNLVLIGLLHDCGKAMIPAQILNAPRSLSLTEFEVIKTHPVYTFDLLDAFPCQIRLAASGHHERVDGTGYPKKLKNLEIPLEARMTAITDIYDAVVSKRAYKNPRSPFAVLAMIKQMQGVQLDSGLVDVFVENMLKQLMNKPMEMSDGSVSIARSYDLDSIEYPTVEINGELIETNKSIYCLSLHSQE